MVATINRCESYIDRHCVDLLVAGTSGLAYDGETFFDDGSGRNFSNIQTGSGTGVDGLRDDLGDVIELYGKMKTDTGEQIEVEPSAVLVPLPLYLDMAEVLKSESASGRVGTGSGAAAKSSGIYNAIREFGLSLQWSRRLTGNDWYVISNTEGMAPIYWQTTLVQGSRIILDIDEANLSSEGWYGIALLFMVLETTVCLLLV